MSKKCTAIKALLWATLLCLGHARAGEVAGTVTQLSGPMMAKKADGKVKILALKSEVESGDTLVTEKNTYALVKFIDNSEITLKPGTTFVVEQFAYHADQPDGDRASFSLLKGGLRSLSGLLGKRNKEKFALKTPVATIGIRGTYFIVQYVPPFAPAPPSAPALAAPPAATTSAPLPAAKPPGAPAPGLYVQVTDGLIVLTNPTGQQPVPAGQFGYVPSLVAPPVIVPPNPATQFAPPPVFNSSTGPAVGVSVNEKANEVNCIVR